MPVANAAAMSAMKRGYSISRILSIIGLGLMRSVPYMYFASGEKFESVIVTESPEIELFILQDALKTPVC